VITARSSREADRHAVARLATTARQLIAGERGGPALLDSLTSVDAMAAASGGSSEFVLVGEIGGCVVGYALVGINGVVGTIAELFVEPEARGVGVGHVLLAEALSALRERGVTRADTSALPGDRSTKNFFEAHGMVTRLLTPSRAL